MRGKQCPRELSAFPTFRATRRIARFYLDERAIKLFVSNILLFLFTVSYDCTILCDLNVVSDSFFLLTRRISPTIFFAS